MCNPACSESGQLLTIQPCGWYVKLQSDRDHLAGVVLGMEEQNARNLEVLRRESDRNDDLLDHRSRLEDEVEKLRQENAALRQEAADWRNAKAVAESKETAVHLALNDMRQERDALLKVREAADALAEAVDGVNPTVLYKRRPQDYVHMTDCEKMNALAMAFKAYKEARVGVLLK